MPIRRTSAFAAGTFVQTAGTNNVGTLSLGISSPNATYILSGPGLLSADNESLTCGASGSFNQSSGTNSSQNLFVGDWDSVTVGTTYNLNGNGLVTSGVEYVGYSVSASFMQTGGTNHVQSALLIGCQDVAVFGPSGTGAYTLSGNSLLSGTNEEVGYRGQLGNLLATKRKEYDVGIVDRSQFQLYAGRRNLAGKRQPLQSGVVFRKRSPVNP